MWLPSALDVSWSLVVFRVIIIIIIIIIILLLCEEIGVKLENKQCYDHEPHSVEINHDCKDPILWNQQVRTGRTIPNYKPDNITGGDKKEHES